MIASLSGTVQYSLPDGVVVNVNGVGYLVHIPAPLLDKVRVGEKVSYYVYHVVRQDTNALYGFDQLEGREFFQHLIGVGGVGPKLALNVLSHMSPEAIRRAVFSEQPDLFARVPGVGKRTAQKIQLYLQDRVTKIEGMIVGTGLDDLDAEVIEALTALGYSVVEAQAAIQSIPKDTPDDLEERLRNALIYFSS